MRLLDVLVGSLVVEAAMAILLLKVSVSDPLRDWYRELGVKAILMDVISLCLGTFAGFQLSNFLIDGAGPLSVALCVLVVQIAHDVAFGLAVLPRMPSNGVNQLFRRYRDEKGLAILKDDALLMLSALAATKATENLPADSKLAVGLFALYAACLLLP